MAKRCELELKHIDSWYSQACEDTEPEGLSFQFQEPLLRAGWAVCLVGKSPEVLTSPRPGKSSSHSSCSNLRARSSLHVNAHLFQAFKSLLWEETRYRP